MNTTNILKTLCLTFLFISCQTNSKTVNYYFDSVNGNDNNEGISIEKPFKTLKKIQEINLRSGDSILLSNGSSFKLKIHLKFHFRILILEQMEAEYLKSIKI